MNNQHFPSRLSPRSVVNARKCFKKPPNACMPSVDAHPAHRRVDSARYRCDYTLPNVKFLYCLPIHKQTHKNKAKINPNLFKRRRTNERTDGRTFDGRNIHARPDDDDGDGDGGYRVVSRTRRVPSASSGWWDARRSGGASLSSVERTTERGRARRVDDDDGDDGEDEDDGVGVGVAKFWWIGRW
jgi:hypothetical protein